MPEEPAKPTPSAGKSPRYWRRRKTTPALRTEEEPFGAGLLPAEPPTPEQATEAPTESGTETPASPVHKGDERAAPPEETGLSASPAVNLRSDDQRQPQSEDQPRRTVDTDSGQPERAEAADAAEEAEDVTDSSARSGQDAAPTEASESPVEQPPERPLTRDMWDPRATTRDLAIELKRIESHIRQLLERVDPKRKRRLEGTRRWHELQEDVMAMHFTSAIDEMSVREILALCARRHRLFERLNFLVATRPTWNT